MSSDEFIAWLDSKIAPYTGKVIPPANIMAERAEVQVREQVQQQIRERVLREAGEESLVAAAMERLQPELKLLQVGLPETVAETLNDEPGNWWRGAVDAKADAFVRGNLAKVHQANGKSAKKSSPSRPPRKDPSSAN
jgi:hypothetical protein